MAGISASAALTLLNSYLKKSGGGKVAALAPSGVHVPIPRTVYKKTTVGEWVMRPIRTLVQITRTIWKTITEAVPRFINHVRQVIDKIVHSEWVTTFKRAAKTFWEKATEKVPLLGLFGKFLGFIWKTIFKPVIRWVTEAIRTLRTWVENVVRTIMEKIQDGWNYITRRVFETIREWVEKTEWVRKWVTKEITVPEIVWDMQLVPLPAMITTSTLLNLLAAGTLTLSMVSLLGGTGEQGCGCAPCPPTATPDYAAPTVAGVFADQTATACVQIDMTYTAMMGTQIAMAFTPTPKPTATPLLFQFPAEKVFTANDQLFTCNDVALYFGIELNALLNANPGLNCNAVNIGVTQFNIPPLTLKSPSEYVAQYNCTPPIGQVCLSPNASVEEMIAYTLFNEGGSSEGNQFSANVMQVILNRANKILDNWGIDRSQMSRDDYARLVLYVISKPAAPGANVAAFEAFSSPSELPTAGTSAENWNIALQIAQAVLDNKGQNWSPILPEPFRPNTSIESQDVLFYCSVRTQENPPLGSTARVPEQGTGSNSVVTYFFNGYQYNQSVAQWCQNNR